MINRAFRIFPLATVAVAIVFAPIPVSAQSVLLSLGDFAVFGGTAISVGGPGPNTVVNGHVGLSPAATTNITGFPPATVSGNTLTGAAATIVATGGQTGQARLDLITAKNALAALPSNVNVSNVDLGTMAALNAGVYTFNGAATQTGALVLDAQGQNGVSWVFQIGTSLTTSVNSSVTFINLGSNGGTDLGLFWNIGTALTVGDNNTILGNYLAGTSISFSGITSTLGGGGARALALAGVSFAGPGNFNALGGPGGGDWDGGLMYNGLGQLVPMLPVVLPPIQPPVVFTGNVLLSSTGAYTAGQSGVILVPGVSYPTTTLTIDGVAANGSAPASLTINTATVTLTGANTYTGGTIVNSGALIASTASLPANQAVTLNSSTLTLDQAGNGTFGGAIGGNGSLIKAGTGAVTITGTNTHTGGTTVNAGSLVTTTANLPSNANIAVNSGGTLVFNQPAAATFSGNITGSGTIQKAGAGVLTLANTTASAVDVQAGALLFNSGVGRTVVAAGALFGGSGTVTGNLTNNGTVSPGFSPGTINVAGNYTQSATGRYLVELASPTSFDRLMVTGSASLAGVLQVDRVGNFNPVGNSFVILTAPGGVTGTFGTLNGSAITSGSAAISTTLTYAPTTVTLGFSQLPFAGFAVTPNQVAVGTAAQAVPTLTTALNVVPQAAQFPGALNALSPQVYQVWSDFAFAHSSSLADRLMRNERAVVGRDDYYFEAGQRQGRARTDRDVGTSKYKTTAGLVGGNHSFNDGIDAGAYFGFGKTTAGLGAAGSDTTVKEKTLGVRAGWVSGPLFADAMVSYGFNDYESTRSIVFPGTAQVARSSTSGHQWTTGANVGRNFALRSLNIAPFGGLLMSRWNAKGFTETGAGEFNARVGSQSARSLRSQLGVDARLDWNLGEVRVQPHVRAAWVHEFSNDSRAMNAAFGSVNYAVKTRRAPSDSVLYSAGLDFVLSPRSLLYTSVSAQSGGTTKVTSDWNVGFSMSL